MRPLKILKQNITYIFKSYVYVCRNIKQSLEGAQQAQSAEGSRMAKESGMG